MRFDDSQKIHLRPGIRLGDAYFLGEVAHYPVKDVDTDRYYVVKRFEHFLLTHMDGSRSIADLFTAFEAHFHRPTTQTERIGILTEFGKKGFVREWCTPELLDQLKEDARSLHQAERERLARNRRILFYPQRWIGPRPLYPLLSKSWIWGFTLVGFTLCCYDFFDHYLHHPLSWHGLPIALIQLGVGLVLMAGFFLTHELAHGLSTLAFGGRCEEIGLKRILLGIPMPYCRIEIDFLSKPQRLYTCFAGLHINLLTLCLVYSILRLAELPPWFEDCLIGFFLLGLASVYLSLNPFLATDGHQILTLWSSRPKLANEAAAGLRRLCFPPFSKQTPLLKPAHVGFVVYSLVYLPVGILLTIGCLAVSGLFLEPSPVIQGGALP